MKNSFDISLKKYAQLIVEIGANVQPGQIVEISAELIHRDLAYEVCDAAYKRGAKHVILLLNEPRLACSKITHSSPEHLDFVPKYYPEMYKEIVDEVGVVIAIEGEEMPGIYSSLDQTKFNRSRYARAKATKFFHDALSNNKVHWCVVAGATPAWALKVYPEHNEATAIEKLWDDIFLFSRVSTDENPVDSWKKHIATLDARAKLLNNYQASKLHFTGPGTDLQVALSEKAIFCAAQSLSPRGTPFVANLPTEEVYTTPDWRGTQGVVSATRPFLVMGTMVEELVLTFDKGEIVDMKAKAGCDAFKAYVESDPAGKRLGEVALVGIDSPIYQSGKVYGEILFDENAACHVAVGSAYRSCLRDGDTMDEKALEAIGCNDSTIHTDIMISSPKVDVAAVLTDGRAVKLIMDGKWVV